MVNIKLFGTLRVLTGIKEINAEAKSVSEACDIVSRKTGISKKKIKNCIVMVDGKQSKMSASLSDGEKIVFLSPAGGG